MMKTVIIKELRLINIGCFAEKEIEFASGNNVILGANGTGKTTIADAISWLFTDKLMNGNTADMRPHDEGGNPRTLADIFVIADIEVDGLEYIFEKSVSLSAKGNTTTYSVNGIQKRPKDFKSVIVDIFGVTQEQLGFCISAQHFLKLDTAKRKAVLFDLVDVDGDEKLAADNEKFTPLCTRLQLASLDACLADCRKNIKETNALLDGLMARTDEVVRASINIPDNEYLKSRTKELNEQMSAVSKQLVATEQTQDLLKEFARHKVKVYEDAVNELFGIAEFTFAEPTLTGDPKDICDLHYKGERYGKRLNSGAKVLLEADIVKGFHEAYGLYFPLIVDNAETCSLSTVASIREMNGTCQTIALVVEDCELTIEN